jgi:hypothetical protein
MVELQAPAAVHEALQVTVSDENCSGPLAVQGSDVAYVNVKQSLRGSVEAAGSDWAARYEDARPQGWDMRVGLVGALARDQRGQRLVELDAQVTLFARQGHTYLGQTRAHCSVSQPIGVEEAKPFSDCLSSLSRDIAAWLEHISP